ncbi:MAG: methylated-DNA--[protein]-cysteine S-methyltransferase [Anaerolineales bacterium]
MILPISIPFSVSQISSTPLGPINIAWTAQGVVAAEIGGALTTFAAHISKQLGDVPTREETSPARPQIEEYLQGKRTKFEVEINWALCTPFQRQVLEQQLAIPYGETRTYGQLAAQIGKPRAARAVGRAGATNPIPLIIPCHRVIGADGSLRGYAAPGGIQTKAWLLALENARK